MAPTHLSVSVYIHKEEHKNAFSFMIQFQLSMFDTEFYKKINKH